MGRQRHKYEYEVSPLAAGAKVARMVGSGQRVLELGSGPGAITRLMHLNGCSVTALEQDEEAIRIVSQYCLDVYPCDLNSPCWTTTLPNGEKFDAIVAGDVLEHLYAPWDTLLAAKSLLKSSGKMVVSLPHIGHNAILSGLIQGHFAYQPWGLLDKTHIRFFGIKDIQKLFDDAGLKIIDAEFVLKTPQQTEFAKNWRRLPRHIQATLIQNPWGTVYQIVVKAVLKTSQGKAIELAKLPFASPPENAFSSGAHGTRMLGYFLSFLSLQQRLKISKFLNKICR